MTKQPFGGFMRFPETRNHQFSWDFSYKPTILGILHQWKTPFSSSFRIVSCFVVSKLLVSAWDWHQYRRQQPRQEAAGFVWDKKQEDVKILAALSYVLLAYGVVLSCPFRMLLMILGVIQVAR